MGIFKRLIKKKPSPREIEDTIISLIQAENIFDAKRIVKDNPVLLNKQGENILIKMATSAKLMGDEYSFNAFKACIALLYQCRQVGIDVAFAEANGLGVDEHEKLEVILQHLDQLSKEERPRRLDLCYQALELLSRDTHPEIWAYLHHEIANNLAQSLSVNQAENIEKAFEHYQKALTIYDRESFPEQWAAIQDNLATTYRKRIRGERAENIEEAIRYCQAALTVKNPRTAPKEWALTIDNLASAYAQRIRGNQAENIEQAIYHYQTVLNTLSSTAFPKQIAITNGNLGNAYKARIHGNLTENIELALEHLQNTLAFFTSENFPDQWATTQLNLSSTYLDRIKGDWIENIEQSIHHCQAALTVYTSEEFPVDWASIQHNLAIAYGKQIQNPQHIKQSLQHYQAALTVYTRENYPTDWAKTQYNLGATFLRQKDEENQAEILEQAIIHIQAALTVLSSDSFPEHWAGVQNLLANAYCKRINGEKGENIEQAIQLYQNALTVCTYETFPREWARTQRNLGSAYQERIQGDPVENRKKAIDHHGASLSVSSPTSFPIECLLAARELGQLFLENSDWINATSAYQKAIEAYEILFHSALTPHNKEWYLANGSDLYRPAAFALAQSGDLLGAVEMLERGRTQLLRDHLERNRSDLGKLPELGYENLYYRYTDAFQRQTFLSQQARTDEQKGTPREANVSTTIRIQQEALNNEIQELVKEIRDVEGYEFFMQSLPITEIQALTINVPLIYILVTDIESLALIVQPNAIASLPLEHLTSQTIREKLVGSGNSPELNSYLVAYFRWLTSSSDPLVSAIERQRAEELWFAALDEVTYWCWGAVMEPITEWLVGQNLDEAVLIPSDLLGLLPLHTAWKPDNGSPTGRYYALDQITFRFAASARALQESQAIAAIISPSSILAIDNPDNTFHFSHEEVIAAMASFPKFHHLAYERATREAVITNLSNYKVLHFSTHGRSGWTDPLRSRLKLADGDLTLAEILELRLSGTRLAVLSACETGLIGTTLPDEVVNLPTGLTQAGVAGVIGSLWSVLEISTAMLIARFYHLWREENLEPASALRQAQIWLRDSTNSEKMLYFQRELSEFAILKGLPPETAKTFFQKVVLGDENARTFAHPFHWAGFTFNGA